MPLALPTQAHTELRGQPVASTINHSELTKTMAMTRTCQQRGPHHLSDADVVFLPFLTK